MYTLLFVYHLIGTLHVNIASETTTHVSIKLVKYAFVF